MTTAFLSFPEQKHLLLAELKNRFHLVQEPSAQYGDLIVYDGLENHPDCINILPYWSRTTLREPFTFHFDSINEAAGTLKQVQRNWAPYQFTCFRRASLIQEKLPYISLKERKFPVTIPQSPMGLYTLLDNNTILASANTSSFLPAGQIRFVEDHTNPPSRAYLKIQEALVMANLLTGTPLPCERQTCFEAGACPGGWTWVLTELGAKVHAVDRAELAPSLMKNPLVRFQKHDAFTLKPEEIGNVDWVFSDVICYPVRLLEWIEKWLTFKQDVNMICTIKMQGEIDWDLIHQFEKIEGSRILHLNYNKHELTFLHTAAGN